MAQAHHVGGPHHGEVLEFGLAKIDTPAGYYRQSETVEIPHHGAFGDFDSIVFVHNSIRSNGDTATQEAIRKYWQEVAHLSGEDK